MRIIEELAKAGNTFTIEDVLRRTGLTRESAWVLLSRLEKRGWIERIERGKYMIIPLGSERGRYTLNEFVIGSLLVKPCVISWWSALSYHGLTEQIPATVFIQTTARKHRQRLEVFGVRYRIVRVNGRKMFGEENVWIEDEQVTVTDREKTIIDCLDRPGYCGGIIEVAKALRAGGFDGGRLSDYAERIGNSGVIRRLGYLCDVLSIHVDLPAINTRNYLLLDPTMPGKGRRDARWRLIINVDLGELE